MGCVVGYISNYENYTSADELKAGRQMTWANEEKIIRCYSSWLEDENLGFRPPLVWAVMEGNMLFVEMLIRHGEEIDKEGKTGGNALSAAILNENIEIFDLLVDNGADIQITYSNKVDGVRPIILASQTGNLSLLSRIINLGADINYAVPDKYGTTALYQALLHGHIESATMLIDVGAQFRPYRFPDGSISERVRQNACLLKEMYPEVFKEIRCG
jgi:ankyrin repeat protein